jgi:exopolyphosphatase/pppGpp-phosphohydrolase
MLFGAIDVGTNSIHLIVDGLDVRRTAVVNAISVRRESGEIVVVAQAESDISGERAAAMLKADLFERVFGVRCAVEAQLAELRT